MREKLTRKGFIKGAGLVFAAAFVGNSFLKNVFASGERGLQDDGKFPVRVRICMDGVLGDGVIPGQLFTGESPKDGICNTPGDVMLGGKSVNLKVVSPDGSERKENFFETGDNGLFNRRISIRPDDKIFITPERKITLLLLHEPPVDSFYSGSRINTMEVTDQNGKKSNVPVLDLLYKTGDDPNPEFGGIPAVRYK